MTVLASEVAMWKAAGPAVDVRGPLDRPVAYNSADRGAPPNALLLLASNA